MQKLIIFLLWIPFLMNGQEITIRGRVVDSKTDEELIGVHVYTPSDWRNGVITGINGEFSLTLSSAEQALIASHVGYYEFSGVLNKNGEIRLKPLVVEGEMVVITATPLVAEEFKYVQLNKLDIYTNPLAKADPILAVNTLPSATTTDESANISLRGSSSLETGTFLNNVPVYDAVRYSQLNGIGTFSIFNTSIIQDVNVFPGNPPLEFGSTTSGVIALKTDEVILESHTTSLIMSLANIGLSREQKINDNLSLKIFSNWQPSKALKYINSEALSEIENFSSVDLGIYWYGTKENYTWKVLNYSVLEGYQFKFNHPSYQGIFNQSKFRSFLISSADFKLKKGTFSINNGLSASRGKFQYSNVAFETQNQDFFLGINYYWLSSRKWMWKTGISLDFRQNTVSGSIHELDYALGENHPTTDYNAGDHIFPIEGFIYGKYFLSHEIAIGAGLRKNIVLDRQPDYLSKQLNLSYKKKEFSVIAGTGKYHKIGFYENSDCKLFSESRQTSIDVRRDGTQSTLSISYFDKVAIFDGLAYEVKGWELFTENKFDKRLSGTTSLTFLNADTPSGQPYLYDIRYFIRTSLTYRTSNFWSVDILASNRQGVISNTITDAIFNETYQVYEPIGRIQQRLPDYFNFGMSVSKMYLLNKERTLIVFINLNNLLNYKNVRDRLYEFDYSSFQNALFSKRTIYIGAVINF